MEDVDVDSIRATVEEGLETFRGTLRSRQKRRFLRDVAGQLSEDERVLPRLGRNRLEARRMMVTFDRRRHDNQFSYGRMDLMLEALDALAGGSGLQRPVSQLRVLSWNGTRRDLRGVLRFLARNNRELRFRRLLVMTYPTPAIGHRLK